MVSQVTPVDDRSEVVIIIRKYSDFTVEQLAAFDMRMEICPAGSESLGFDLLGDPLCRVRHLPSFHMLVTNRFNSTY